MILYLDASALVKLYLAETGSDAVAEVTAGTDIVGSLAISRAEVSAAIGKAV